MACGSGPDRVAALFGRERRVRGAAGEDGVEGDDGRRLIRRAADRAAEIEDIGQLLERRREKSNVWMPVQ